MMKWGLHGSRLKLIFFALCIFAAALIVLFVSRSKIFIGGKDYANVQYFAKLYCNKPGTVFGDEGQLKFIKGAKRSYELQQIHLVIRHGDRAPIVLDTLPNSKPVEISCMFNKSWYFYKDLLEIKQGKEKFQVTGKKQYPVVMERVVCLGAQLTPIGFSQHLNNGKFLKRQYDSFIESIQESSQVTVKSTAYSRTVQSAASLLYGVFGDKFTEEKLKINVVNDKYRETHFLQHLSGENIFCPALSHKLKDVWKKEKLIHLSNDVIKPIQEQFAVIFNSHMGKIASLDRLVDILYANLCHDRELPMGPNGDITYKLASKSFGTADLLITVKHAQLAELQTLAIISQIVEKISQLVDEQKGGDPISSKLTIFSGHDTIISPLLSMLGVHNWRWPPYASRLVFELWKDTNGVENRGGGAKLLSKFDNYFIRVLYNGIDLTSKVIICQGQTINNQLCPVSAFVKYVSDDQFDGKNYFERIKNICIGTDTD